MTHRLIVRAPAICLFLLAVLFPVSVTPAAEPADDPVTFCVDPDWPPYEVINAEGMHEGIAGDLLRLAAERAGIRLQMVRTKDWDESIAASQAGRCQLLSFLNQTPKRDAWLIFTEPLFVDPNVIVTREEHAFIADLAAVSKETLALPKGTSIEERVRRDFPALKIMVTDTEAEAFAMVSEKKADMTIRSLIVAVYTIKKEGWFNLKISGQIPGYENRLRIGVLKDNTALRDRLNGAIATISAAEVGEISNRHVSINVQTATDYASMVKIVAVFSLVLATNVFWIVKLRKANRRLTIQSRTDILTGVANRAMLNERFTREVDRAGRYGRPLSAILLDIDHFKKINDAYGHLVGDQVLIAFAGLVSSNVRGSDTAGRWGGEEFLVLCPETGWEDALVVAERIRRAVEEFTFVGVRRQTASIGVASLRPGDGVDDLLLRADEALYRAKGEGRNRICCSEVD